MSLNGLCLKITAYRIQKTSHVSVIKLLDEMLLYFQLGSQFTRLQEIDIIAQRALLPGNCSMRGHRKSTLVDRHAPEAIATAVTATCASVDATAPCTAPLPPAPAAAAAAITSRAPTSAAEATARRGATWSSSTHPTFIRARVAAAPRAPAAAAGSSARRRPSIPESEADVDAGDGVMRASEPGGRPRSYLILATRVTHTAREWRRADEEWRG
jgi:hypothetical protein